MTYHLGDTDVHMYASQPIPPRRTALDAMRDARAENIANGAPSLPSVMDATDAQLQFIAGLLTARIHPYASDDLAECVKVWKRGVPLTKDEASRTITFLRNCDRRMPVQSSSWSEVARLAKSLAGHRFATTGDDGTTDFWFVSEWVGRNDRTMYSVKPIVGGSDDPRFARMSAEAQVAVLTKISVDPEAASIRYGTETGRCEDCNRLLTDSDSVAAGRGPICRNKSRGW